MNSISRRRFLQVTAAAAPLLPGTAWAIESNSERNFPGFIDAHSHVWSRDTKRYPVGAWVEKEKMDPSFTPEDLLKIAGANGVDRVVLIQHAPYHGYDNSYILKAARDHKGVFSVVGMIDERKPRLKERLTELKDQGVRGIRVQPTIHADRTVKKTPMEWLQAEEMKQLWKHAADLRVAVCPLLGPEHLPTLDPMCEQYPETICVIDHFGHVDVSDKKGMSALASLAKHPNVYVKVSGFYKFGDKKAPYEDLAPLIRQTVDAFGAERLMWASDCPYQLRNGNTYADAVALIREQLAFLSNGDRQAILRDTAEKVFFG